MRRAWWWKPRAEGGSGGALSANWLRSGVVFPAFMLNLFLDGGLTLAPGRYALPAVGFGPQLSLGGTDSFQACGGAGEIVVHALRRDADGQLLELALDTERDCGSPLRQGVSLRLNSQQALPP